MPNYQVAGAGSTDYNGLYVDQNSPYSGYPTYKYAGGSGDRWLWCDGWEWLLSPNVGDAYYDWYYVNWYNNPPTTPDSGDWYEFNGTSPAPSVTEVSGHSISGTIADDSSAPAEGVEVEATASGQSAVSDATDEDGEYTLAGLADATWTVTPTLAGHQFEPSSREVVISGADETEVDFRIGQVTPVRNLFAGSGAPVALRETSGRAQNVFTAEANTWPLQFTYDRVGNLIDVRDPDAGHTTYTYDALRRMTSVTNPWDETTYYEYSLGGRMLSRVLGNGCVTYFSYERGQVSKVENLKADLSPISSFEYERDVVGNPLSITREDGSVTYYDYDKKYQLISEIQTDDQLQVIYAWSWDYDKAGNRLQQTFNGAPTYYEYNAANELLTETATAGTTYYEYDHRGNQTVKAAPEGTTYFEFNPQNLLTKITLPDESENTFGYDADSKRVWANDSDGARRMIYQGPNMLALLQERDGYGTIVQYTMGTGLESERRRSE